MWKEERHPSPSRCRQACPTGEGKRARPCTGPDPSPNVTRLRRQRYCVAKSRIRGNANRQGRPQLLRAAGGEKHVEAALGCLVCGGGADTRGCTGDHGPRPAVVGRGGVRGREQRKTAQREHRQQNATVTGINRPTTRNSLDTHMSCKSKVT